jgi:hypothetical protein
MTMEGRRVLPTGFSNGLLVRQDLAQEASGPLLFRMGEERLRRVLLDDLAAV